MIALILIRGLDITDRRYLDCLIDRFKGLASRTRSPCCYNLEEAVTLEDVNEPYLLQEGYIVRTPRGRMATEKAYKHLNKDKGTLL